MPLPYRGSQLAAGLGAIRVGLGVAMLTRPLLLPRPLGIDSVTAGRVDWLVRMAGARDLALGAGTLAAAKTGGQRTWLAASLASDVADAVILTGAIRSGRIGRIMGGTAALSAVVAAAAGAVALGSTNGSVDAAS
ncbi:MAG: hypothetical protein ACJ735_13325 [Actinomycetes bacterium]